jgi:hypothetical protein
MATEGDDIAWVCMTTMDKEKPSANWMWDEDYGLSSGDEMEQPLHVEEQTFESKIPEVGLERSRKSFRVPHPVTLALGSARAKSKSCVGSLAAQLKRLS